MKTEQAIKFFGSEAALAAKLKDNKRGLIGITASAVHQWGEYPPRSRQEEIEALTEGKLKVTRTKV